jgi:hypothetical protein
MSLESITQEIREQISRLNQVLHLLEGGAKQKATKQAKTPGPKHKISAAGRRRIAAAQRARWARIRAGKK